MFTASETVSNTILVKSFWSKQKNEDGSSLNNYQFKQLLWLVTGQ